VNSYRNIQVKIVSFVPANEKLAEYLSDQWLAVLMQAKPQDCQLQSLGKT
jgi:hypothetical protein